jgi:hypothetical protein
MREFRRFRACQKHQKELAANRYPRHDGPLALSVKWKPFRDCLMLALNDRYPIADSQSRMEGELAIGYWLLAIRSEHQASSEKADW